MAEQKWVEREAEIPAGLSLDEVKARQQEGKTNRYKSRDSKSTLSIILGQLVTLSNGIIFTAVAFLVLYGQIDDAVLISMVITSNMLVSIFQELRARASLQKISVVTKEQIKVRRGGETVELDPDDLVLDEVVELQSGSYLFVDGEYVSGQQLLVDESILTGESDYQTKVQGDKLLSGSFIVSGTGYYRATAVGKDSFVNKITAAARSYINYLSPLQVEINKVVTVLAVLTVLVIALLFSLNYFVLHMSELELLAAVVAIVSSMVPQGIVITLTLAFMLGVLRMYRVGILVQKASAVEALAGVKVLCMDKTGTLTANKLQLVRLNFGETELKADERGKLELPEKLTREQREHLNLLAAYCTLVPERNKTLNALVNSMQGFDSKTNAELTAVLPFTSQQKFGGLEFRLAGQAYRVVLGAPEILMPWLQQAGDAKRVAALDKNYAAYGYRNLVAAFAAVEVGATGKVKYVKAADWNKTEFKLLALLSIEDKLRAGAKEIIEEFRAQGIKPIIISGDGAATLTALVNQLQVKKLDKVITGPELTEAQADGEGEFTEAVLGHDIFARVTPEQKLEIVKVLQRAYGRVAMVGDGVNDALAIKQANLGVSLASGANVTKNISDVILLDNDFRKLADVMAQGKEILFNTLRSAQLLIIKNFYSLIILVVALVLALPFPFNFRGLFLLAFINANLPIVLLFFQKLPKLKQVHFMRELLHFAGVGGVACGLISLALLGLLAPQYDQQTLQNIILLFLVCSGLVNSLIILNRTYSPVKALFGSWYSILAPVTLGFYWLLLQIEFTREIFELRFLDSYVLLMVGFAVLLYFGGFSLGLAWLPKFRAYERILPKQ